MVSSNQRSIHEGIRKVVGSSNRGFITLDPERQPRIITQPAKASGAASEFTLLPVRPGSSETGGRSSRP